MPNYNFLEMLIRKNFSILPNSIFLFLAALTLFSSCGNGSSGSSGQADSAASSQSQEEEQFHASNDILNHLSSIIDTFRVGDEISAADYDWTGILTDGEGKPLYTDHDMNPGEWEIKVLDPDRVCLRSLHKGDLAMNDLTAYLVEGLGLSPENQMPQESDASDGVIFEAYSFGPGIISFEIHPEKSPLGEEGPFYAVNILKL